MANLEELLLKITDVKTLTESQSNETLRTVLEPEVRSFVKESLEKKDYVMKEDETTDYDEEVVDAEGGMDDASMEPEVSPEETPEMGDDMGDDMGSEELPAELSPSNPEDEEVLDLTDASLEEVMERLKNLPDDTVIEIVKNPPTYGVSTSSELNEEEGVCEGCDDEDYMDEGYGRNHMEEGDDSEDIDEMYDADANEIDEWIEEALQESANERKVNEYKAIVEQYENKLSKMAARHAAEVNAMNEQLTIQRRKVKTLTEERQKYNKALTESHQILDQLAVHNTNLLHITKLFTEQTVSRNEKIEIAKQFDNVKTVNESKILFEALSKTLPKKSPTAENAVQLKEQMTTVKSTAGENNRVTLKEEKTFNDPALERFNELIKYKI